MFYNDYIFSVFIWIYHSSVSKIYHNDIQPKLTLASMFVALLLDTKM